MDIQELLGRTAMQISVKSRQDGETFSEHRQKAEDRFYEAFAEDAERARADKAKRLREASNLGARFARRTFETFERERDPEAYDKCLHYLEHYKDDERNCLLLVGGYGTGKTHLAASIANRLMDNGVPVLYDTFGRHLNKLRAEFNGGQSVYLGQMESIDMLILDDAGKEKVSEWSRSVMFDVINYRYEHLLPIIITTNLTGNALADYLGGAIWSRIVSMSTGVAMKGGDYRQK